MVGNAKSPRLCLRLGVILSSALLIGACMASDKNMSDPQSMAEPSIAEALAYVELQGDECVLVDAYQCQSNAPSPNESSRVFSDAIDLGGTLPALMVSTWPVALERFLADDMLSDEQKKLKHYRVGFSLSNQQVTVLFRPLFLPQMDQGEVVGRMRATIGRELRVTVDLTTLLVTKVIYGK